MSFNPVQYFFIITICLSINTGISHDLLQTSAPESVQADSNHRLVKNTEPLLPISISQSYSHVSPDNPILGMTYVGGSGYEEAFLRAPCAVASDGSVYVGGWTTSSNFPVPEKLNSPTSYPPGEAAFIAKFSSDLSTLLAVSILDGVGSDKISAIALGQDGHVYVAGNTTSTNFPITSNAYDTKFNGTRVGQDPYGDGDIFIAKFSSDLGTPEVCTFLGGSGAEHTHTLAIGPDGSIIISGSTKSSDFPKSLNAYDTIVNPNGYFGLDAFVSVLDADLSTLIAGTFIGGSGDDFAEAVIVSPDGDIYVGGWTSSTNYPLVSPLYSYQGGSYDGFLSKFNSSLTTLEASTCIGGAYWDFILALCIDSSGSVFVTGHTASRGSFPVASGCYDNTYNGDLGEGTTDDSYVAKFSSDLLSLQASTYLGGTLWEVGISIACDSSNRVFVVNSTNSTNFPKATWVIDTTYNGGAHDIAIACLSNDLKTLYFSSYFGGVGNDENPGMGFDNNANLFISFPTQSGNLPRIPSCYDTLLSGSWDIAVAKISRDVYFDTDNDTVSDISDNCMFIPNPNQEDNNHDGIGNACCCNGTRGDVDLIDIVDISDLSLLISFLTGGGDTLPCPEEANIDGEGIVDITDLSVLVDYLMGGGYALPNCP